MSHPENSNPSPPLLSMHDVSIALNGQSLLAGTDWVIRSDEHWVVVGPNGSGKSTLVRALCGEMPLASGRIVFQEQGSDPEYAAGAAALQRIAEIVSFDAQKRLLRREGGFHQARWNSLSSEESPTVSDYLSEERIFRTNPFEARPKSPDPSLFLKRREEIVELVGIRALMEKHVAQLSSGETRKLLIARALLRNPRLLILDNPFAGLDAGYRKTLKATLERLMGGAMRLVLVTTRREEIPSGITHALVVQDYRVVAQGPLEEVLAGDQVKRILQGEEDSDPVAPTAEPTPRPLHRIGGEDKGEELVRMNDVRVRYGDHEILRGIDWTIRKGEHWVLMGNNGSGKSTLLSLILGDNPQCYANDIRLFGVQRGSGESIWEIKERVGYVAPELLAYFPWKMSCLDVICSGFFDSIGLYRSCSEEQRQKAAGWLDQMGFRKHGPKSFQSVSEGEQRMILLARALVKRPVLLILDEPSQGLDLHHRNRFMKMVDEAGDERQATIIYVTHIPSEVPSLINRRLLIDTGRVVERGPWHLQDTKRMVHSCGEGTLTCN
jgi:molybdate transport system ATP-binding protein